MANEPSENWDDDFDFQANASPRSTTLILNPYDTTAARPATSSLRPPSTIRPTSHERGTDDTANSRFSFNSQAWDEAEDDEDDTAKAGPSQPRTSTPSVIVQRPSRSRLNDNTDFTHPSPATPTVDLSRWQEPDETTTVDFGDDFGLAPTSPDVDRTVTARKKLSSPAKVKATASSSKRVQSSIPLDKSWTEDEDDGFYDRDFADDDPPAASNRMNPFPMARTPSAASTSSSGHYDLHSYQRAGPNSSSSLQLPSMSPGFRVRTGSPGPQIATSPTVSMFSSSSRDAPSYLTLRHTPSHASSALPLLPTAASPPRPRRRLRKKSRPQDVGPEVYEMQTQQRPRQIGSMIDYGYLDDHSVEFIDEMDEDRALEDQRQAALHESVSHPGPSVPRSASPPLIASSHSHTVPILPPSSPPTKTPLLSRLGSVKRWRSRRSSTTSGPDLNAGTTSPSPDSSFNSQHYPYAPPKTPEPALGRSITPSSPPSASKHYWLFRNSPGSKNSKAGPSSPTTPEIKRSNSKGKGSDRPLSSRFGRKRSTTVSSVPEEEDVSLDTDIGLHLNLIGKGKSPDVGQVPKAATTGSRRPLSLQPQPASMSSKSSGIGRVGWVVSSMGRSAISPFSSNGGGSGEVQLEPLRKRLPNSNAVKKRASYTGSILWSHSRSLSQTSDPDEAKFRTTPLSSPTLEVPPVPPIPQSILSLASASSSSVSLSNHHSRDGGSGRAVFNSSTTSLALAPPIALSPPSPPRKSISTDESTPRRWTMQPRAISASHSAPANGPTTPTESGPMFTASTLTASPGAGQSHSLGRAALLDTYGNATKAFAEGTHIQQHLRRNSLGDLKIPARISMAQSGLRTNLGMVREFANKVDELQKLVDAHTGLLGDFERLSFPYNSPYNTHTSTMTTSFDVQEAFSRLERDYALWWECAELLVELGGSGSPKEPATSSVPQPGSTLTAEQTDEDTTITIAGNPVRPGRNRERAVTLAGDIQPPTLTSFATVGPSVSTPSESPLAVTSPSHWRASTGRHDLSSRQLTLLKEMLSTPDPRAFNRQYGPNGMNGGIRFASQPVGLHAAATSAITLPSIPSSPPPRTITDSPSRQTDSPSIVPETQGGSRGKIRRASRAGLTSLRDMLRALTNKPPIPREAPPSPHSGVGGPSVTSSSPSSSDVEQPVPEGRKQHRYRKSTDATAAVSAFFSGSSLKKTTSPYDSSATRSSTNAANTRKSPRRPSLASIFRIGQSHSSGNVELPGSRRRKAGKKSSTGPSSGRMGAGPAGGSTTEEDDYSDWDRMDSASDMEDARLGSGTSRSREEKDDVVRRRSSKRRNEATVKGRQGHHVRSSSRTLAPSASNGSMLSNGRITPSLPNASTSQLSLHRGPRQPRSPPANGKYLGFTDAQAQQQQLSAPLPPRSATKSPTMRSAPPTSLMHSSGGAELGADLSTGGDFKLALTPDNIKPLLEYAKEVSVRLNECLSELRELTMSVGHSGTGTGSADMLGSSTPALVQGVVM